MFSYYRICSLTIERDLLLQVRIAAEAQGEGGGGGAGATCSSRKSIAGSGELAGRDARGGEAEWA